MVKISWTPESDPKISLPLAFLQVQALEVKKRDKTLDQIINEREDQLRASLDLPSLKDNPIVRWYRDFYWQYLDIDPTKKRPSGEALARRILGGNSLPRISTIVDAYNIISAASLIPLSGYDMANLTGDLVLRTARKGESFRLIGGKEIALNGKEILLGTTSGQNLCIYPYRDADPTKITLNTTKILFVAYGTPETPGEVLRNTLVDLQKLLVLILPVTEFGKIEQAIMGPR